MGCYHIDKKLRNVIKFRQKIRTEYIKTRDMEQFIEITQNRFDVIIDIRNNVYNKGTQGFMPKVLGLIMKLIGKEYYRFQRLGNPKKLREKAIKDAMGDINAQDQIAKKLYLNYLITDKQARNSFLQLYNKINSAQKRFCLICYCDTEDPKKCHRFWLLEALVNYERRLLELPQNYIYEPITLSELTETGGFK